MTSLISITIFECTCMRPCMYVCIIFLYKKFLYKIKLVDFNLTFLFPEHK